MRHGSALHLKEQPAGEVSFWKTFMMGVGINLTNPKVVLFFVTFLPLFVQAGDPDAAGKLVFLGLYYVALTGPMSALMIMSAAWVIATLRHHPSRAARHRLQLRGSVLGLRDQDPGDLDAVGQRSRAQAGDAATRLRPAIVQ